MKKLLPTLLLYFKNMNTGWKRIHVVLPFLGSLTILVDVWIPGFKGFTIGLEGELLFIPFAILSFLLLYFLIVIMIEWIIEGFKKNE